MKTFSGGGGGGGDKMQQVSTINLDNYKHRRTGHKVRSCRGGGRKLLYIFEDGRNM